MMPATMAASADGEEPGAIVRPYALTGGRTRPRFEIAIEALLVTTPHGRAKPQHNQGGEHMRILSLCGRGPVSLAEVSALTRLPLGVTRVILSDMITSGLVALAGRTATDDRDLGRGDLLERVLTGLRRL
jgi:hypothetical protein